MNDDSAYELTLDDISDLRAYENERDQFRSYIIGEKRKRRIHVGPFQSLVFENRDTIRFQIQEMARAEKIITDEGIETELRMYNPLISRPGKLSATLFLELTSDEQLREWLPKLVGIERSYMLQVGDVGKGPDEIMCQVDSDHDEALTREDVTASVHYVWWSISQAQALRLRDESARLICVHPDYKEQIELSETTRISLTDDLVNR